MEKARPFFRLIEQAYRPFVRPMTLILFLLVAAQVVHLALPFWHGKLIDNLARNAPLGDSFLLIGSILASYAAVTFLTYLRDQYENERFDYDIFRLIELNTFQKLFKFSLGQHVNESSGLRIGVVRKGEKALIELARALIYMVIPIGFQVLLTLAVLIWLNPVIGLVVICTSGIFFGILYRYNIRFYNEKLKKIRDRWNRQEKFQAEIFKNIKLVKVAAKEKEMARAYGASFHPLQAESIAIWKGYNRMWYSSQGMLHLGHVLALAVGIYLVHTGVESPGAIVMLVGWVGNVFSNIMNLGHLQRNLMEAVGNAHRYSDMLAQEPAVKDPELPILVDRIEGRIEFKNLSFKYPKLKSVGDEEPSEEDPREEEEEVSKEILQDVSFGINPGETVAIFGHSGAGKTTLVNLLLRYYDPDGGFILVDGTDLRQLQLKSYRARIGYVTQHVELFDDTLRNNLLFELPEGAAATEDDIERVARKARIDQFYDRLGKKRFDTLIGENGLKLSGGERQRVSIARALLKNPDIFIFDEATSSLDAENEALIQEAMREALDGRTGIIIAHRFSTIKDADKIIVLDKGRVDCVGRHEELSETCDLYRRLLKRQVVMV